MNNFAKRTIYARLIALFAFFLIVGVTLALTRGIGWFFLLESIRRVIVYIPSLNRKLRKLILEEEYQSSSSSELEEVHLSPISKLMRAVILLFWLGMTFFSFVKLDFPLLDLFK